MNYEAFLIGVAALERILRRMVTRPVAGMLLKDLIASPEVRTALGTGTVATLQSLFSPQLLNLRNLVWHGFVVAGELDRRHTALLLLCVLHAANKLRPLMATLPPPPRLWQPCEADALLADALPVLLVATGEEGSGIDDGDGIPVDLARSLGFPAPPHDGCCPVCLRSPFCRPGFANTLRMGLAAYAQGCHASFCLLVLPALEAGLRFMFVAANPSEAMLGDAHLGAYFSTLDGYGQKAKHQLLLSSSLHSNPSQPNRLPETLGAGIHSLLLDLFMHAAGPALRAKYAHGEAEMVAADGERETDEGTRGGPSGHDAHAYAFNQGAPPAPPIALQLLYALLLTLCARAYEEEPSMLRETVACGRSHGGEDGAAARLRYILQAAERLDRYRSVCDPMVRLRKTSERVDSAVCGAVAEGEHYCWVDRNNVGSGVPCGTVRLRVPSSAAVGEGVAGSLPMSSRVVTVACDVRQCDEAAASRIESFSARVAAARAALQRSNARGGCEDGPADVGYAGSSTENDAAVHPEALAEGALVECSRWGVLSCVERFVANERSRLAELTDRVDRRVASTAQRRTFLMACHATLGLRRLAALILDLARARPVRAAGAGADLGGTSGGGGGGGGGHPAGHGDRMSDGVPLTRLHAIAQTLCAVHEGNKGVDHAIAAGDAFLQTAMVRRQLGQM